MRPRQLNVSAVLVGERYRRDLGDLTGLMRSMERDGQLHPIIVLDNHELLSGERRLEAARRLGWPTIQAYTVRKLKDALEALRVDWESANNTEYCLTMKPSERVAQVEPLHALHARERIMPPKDTSRNERWAYQVEPHLANLLGIGMTSYRLIRLAVLATKGRRPTPGRAVTDLDRKLAQQAVDLIDDGVAVDTVGVKLRAQLGYARNGRIPTLPTDPDRLPQIRFRVPRAPTSKGRRTPLRDQVSVTVSQILQGARRLTKLAEDDRWLAQREQIPPSVRTSLREATDWILAVQQQIPPPTTMTTKETS